MGRIQATEVTHGDAVMQELAAKLKALYTERPDVSYRDIERALIPLLGNEAPTGETIRQYHFGKVSRKRANVMLIAAICDFYGVKVADVSPWFAERAEGYKGVLARSGCIGEWAGQVLCGTAA